MSGRRVEFDSDRSQQVKVYSCGLTVYDRAHIGHAKTIVFFDVLRRLLEAKGFEVRYVQNFTDVDDKIIARAKELGVTASAVSEKYISEYYSDFDSLNVRRADVSPRATEVMDEIIDLIRGLVERGFAYVVPSGVYLDVTKVPAYGKLSKVRVSELRAGARVEPDQFKRDPADFALWKVYSDEPLWDSPWGKGRPGWHIECSAMVHRFLGEPLDIHGGGEDLIFPHHENEIAQSESLFSKPLARTWVHVGMLRLSGEKMSKSVGNVVPVAEFVETWGANTLRYYLVSNLYRKQLDHSSNSVQNARENWRVIEAAAAVAERFPKIGTGNDGSAEALTRFDSALSDDMDTPRALVELLKLSRAVNTHFSKGKLEGDGVGRLSSTFKTMFNVFGFFLLKLPDPQYKEAEALVQDRNELRKKGEYVNADRIREDLERKGIVLLDHPGGTVWYRSEYLRPPPP